ncbi:MAG: 50S ribosomal protein L24 [Candidatus Nanopelagicales bacterium]
MAKVKKGDVVLVIAGKDRGVKGKVLKVLAEQDKVLVEGVNRAIKHTKVTDATRGGKQGGIVHEEAAIHVSNVQVLGDDGKPTRLGSRKEKVDKRRTDGSTYEAERNVRIERRSGKDI